MRTATL